MTFPQPSSTNPVTHGQEYFRLTTELASAGDIYECETGALAFALGPNSDIATVLISYFDENMSTKVAQSVLSPDRSYIGRVDARMTDVYPAPGKRKARILLSVQDIYNPDFRPDDTVYGGFPVPFDPTKDSVTFVTPILDVIQYFQSAPSLIPQRSDRNFRFQYFPLPVGAGGVTWIAIPGYGRKSGYFSISGGGGVGTIDMQLIGAKLAASGPSIPAGANQKQLAHAAMLGDDTERFVYKSSTDGLWDLFLIGLGSGGGSDYDGRTFPVDIVLSDDIL